MVKLDKKRQRLYKIVVKSLFVIKPLFPISKNLKQFLIYHLLNHNLQNLNIIYIQEKIDKYSLFSPVITWNNLLLI